jgi:hypothetical protein
MTLPSDDMWESLVAASDTAILVRTHECAMGRGALRVGRQTRSLAANRRCTVYDKGEQCASRRL